MLKFFPTNAFRINLQRINIPQRFNLVISNPISIFISSHIKQVSRKPSPFLGFTFHVFIRTNLPLRILFASNFKLLPSLKWLSRHFQICTVSHISITIANRYSCNWRNVSPVSIWGSGCKHTLVYKFIYTALDTTDGADTR